MLTERKSIYGSDKGKENKRQENTKNKDVIITRSISTPVKMGSGTVFSKLEIKGLSDTVHFSH